MKKIAYYCQVDYKKNGKMKSFMFKEFLLKQVVAKVKTQTRRTHGLEKVNHNPGRYKFHALLPQITEKYQLYALFVDLDNPSTSALVSCKPKYQIGDICYLKENYAIAGNTTHHHIYQSDYDPEARKNIKWKSKLMMPAVSARYKVQITGIRVERLQDISEYDAIQEGIVNHWFCTKYYQCYLDVEGFYKQAIDSFRSLWYFINGNDSWNKNPWVFVYEFKLIDNG
jgi:hypothetical protein